MIIIMGSPHTNGNVARAVDSLIEGVNQNNVKYIKYELCKMNIKNCIGCRKCIDNGGRCVLKDDMHEVFEQIKSADIVVIASPIYICQVNGFTKTFLDRLYPLTDRWHKPRFGKRDLIMLYTYGAPVPFLFRRYMRQTGKALKAMGLKLKKTIILQGCTSIDKTKNNEKRLKKLRYIGSKL
ncbi:hypothetical protein AN641_05635 [Candidatus Epulonipiscioides gigas]|nr:hypothetical protein AN641_07755 [Epulopiscium sp. SCG-C07WGA-EpuloA2]ONI44861.1 hypothetical protein AN641_05635 [Epulopiscium sp. SCG-C07WGA-EpuloA2]